MDNDASMRAIKQRISEANAGKIDEAPLSQSPADSDQTLISSRSTDGHSKNLTEESNKDNSLVAGYKMDDLLGAAVKPPNPMVTEDKSMTTNPKVNFLFIVGLGLIVISCLLLVLSINALVCSLLGLLGAAIIVITVFRPIK